MIPCNTYYDSYRTRTFSDIFPTFGSFQIANPANSGSPSYDTYWYLFNITMDVSIKRQLYYTLYAYYGNSHVASSDENRFKTKLFSLIEQYAPNWEKRLDIQKKLRAMTDEEITLGREATYNHAFNPETSPNTSSRDAINFINDQNKTLHTKSKIEGYANLLELLDDDFTKEFIDRFKNLFIAVAATDTPLLYATFPEDDE